MLHWVVGAMQEGMWGRWGAMNSPCLTNHQKLGPQTHSHRKPDCENNLDDLRKRFFPGSYIKTQPDLDFDLLRAQTSEPGHLTYTTVS